MDSAPTYVAAILSVKEKILKAAREKQEVTYKRAPIRLGDDFSTETSQKGMAKNISSNEKQRSATKTTLPSKSLN